MRESTRVRTPPESNCIDVRRMLPEDIDSVVRVHLESFPGFLLSLLGPSFLRLFYQAILNDANGIAVVAERGHAIIGFVCGSSAPQGFYRRLLKRQCWKFGWAAMHALVGRPSMVRHFIGAVRARVFPPDGTQGAELMSLATSCDARGQGIGGDLVIRFLSEACRSGASRVTLTTDRRDNQQVNSFYRQLGFTLTNSFVTNTGREMNLYEITTLIIPPTT